MGTAHQDVTLAIVAGGRGRRLGGVPKGLLLRDGKPLLSHLLGLGQGFAETLLVTSEPAPYAGYAVRTVADVVPNRGAPGGVHAALFHATTPWVVVVAIDMPFVTRPVLELLLAQRSAAVDALGFEVDGRLEPLLACYRSTLAPKWGLALAANPSFRDLWQTVRTGLLPQRLLLSLDGGIRAVVSVNTKEDAEACGLALPPLVR